MELSSNPSTQVGLEPMIDVRGLAEYLGVPVSTVYEWRSNRKGPAAYRFGKRIMFAQSDVQAWVAAQREPGPRPPTVHGR